MLLKAWRAASSEGKSPTGVLPQASCVLIRKVMDGAQDCTPVSGMHPCNKPPSVRRERWRVVVGGLKGGGPRLERGLVLDRLHNRYGSAP